MLYGRARLRLPQATREEFCAMLAVAHGGLGDGLHLYQGLALPTSLAAHRAQPLCSCRTPLARDRHATHARGRCFCGRCGRGSRARRGGQRAARALARRAHGGWWPPRRSRVGVRRHRAARAQRARRRTVPACRRPLTAKVCLRRALCYRGWLLASTESERCCMAQPHIHGTTRPLVSRALQAATPPRRHVATSPRRHVATSSQRLQSTSQAGAWAAAVVVTARRPCCNGSRACGVMCCYGDSLLRTSSEHLSSEAQLSSLRSVRGLCVVVSTCRL